MKGHVWLTVRYRLVHAPSTESKSHNTVVVIELTTSVNETIRTEFVRLVVDQRVVSERPSNPSKWCSSNLNSTYHMLSRTVLPAITIFEVASGYQ